MSADAVMREYLERTWNAHDLAGFERYVSRDVKFHPPRGGTKGYDDYLAMARHFLHAFPDLRFVIEQTIAQGELAAAQIRIQGTHGGEWRGVHPTGRRIDVAGRPWCRVRDGKVVEFWSNFDEAHILRQLGVLGETVVPG